MSSLPLKNVRRVTVCGYAAGALFMTFIGALWASFAACVLGPRERVVLLSVVGIVDVAPAVDSVRLLRVAGRLPQGTSEEARARGRSIGRRFFAVLTVEFAAIAIASNLLVERGRRHGDARHPPEPETAAPVRVGEGTSTVYGKTSRPSELR